MLGSGPSRYSPMNSTNPLIYFVLTPTLGSGPSRYSPMNSTKPLIYFVLTPTLLTPTLFFVEAVEEFGFGAGEFAGFHHFFKAGTLLYEPGGTLVELTFRILFSHFLYGFLLL